MGNVWTLAVCLTLAYLTSLDAQTPDSCAMVWSSVRQISLDTSNVTGPAIITSGSSVLVVWGHPPFGDYSANFSISTDDGNSWSMPALLVPDSIKSGNGTPLLASTSQDVYAFWSKCDSCFIRRELLFKHSSDGGFTWSPPQFACWTGGIYAASALFSAIFISMKDTANNNQIARSTDYGNSWTYLPAPIPFRRIVAAPSGLHAIQQTSSSDVSYYYSGDFGATWEPPQLLSTLDAYVSQHPELAADEWNNVYAVWLDGKYGGDFSGTVLFRRSTDRGYTWLDEQIVSQLATTKFPAIAVVGDRVATAWLEDTSNTTHVYFSASADNGTSWCGPVRVSEQVGNNVPRVSGSPGDFHITWAGSPSATTQVFHRRAALDSLTSVEASPVEREAILLGAPYPNPTNSLVTIHYSVLQGGSVRVQVFDLLGQLVRTLVDAIQSEGNYSVTWDGKNDHNVVVGTGIYICHLSAERVYATRTMAIVK